MTQGQHYATSSYTEKRKSKSRKRTLIIALIAIAIIAVIGFVACQNLFGDKTGQVRQGAEIEVVIPAGASTDKIASILVDDGVIPSAKAFTDRVKQLGQASSLQSGSYLLIGGDDIDTIIKILASGQTGRQLVIPEGYNLRQIADKVEATCGIDAEEFYAQTQKASDYVADYPFLEGVYNDSMEGFLYPETYSFYTDATARDIVTTQLREFEKKVLTEENKAALADSGFTLEEWVIFASIVQKESASVEEMYNVYSVFHNRLSNASEYPMLQSCTTNNFIWDYVEPYYNDNVPQAVLDAYDTYDRNGLPIGAIANAGSDAFDASLHPNDTPYYFFVTDVEYTHYYAVTYQQHLANIEKAKAVNAKHGINGLVTG